MQLLLAPTDHNQPACGADTDFLGRAQIRAKTLEPGTFNRPPSAGLQFFSQMQIVGSTKVMTLRDLAGTALYTQEIEPAF